MRSTKTIKGNNPLSKTVMIQGILREVPENHTLRALMVIQAKKEMVKKNIN